MGVQGGKEKPLDLLLSGLVTVLIGWALISYATAPNPVVGPSGIICIGVGLVIARLTWLARTYAYRTCSGALWQAPTGAILPGSGRVVDIRPVTEAFLFPVAWYRLSRQLTDLRAEARYRRGGLATKQKTISVRALLSAAALSLSILFVFYAPVLAVRVGRAHGVAPRGIRDPGVWAVIAATGGALIASVVFWRSPASSRTAAVAGLLLVILFFVGMAATQFLHNRIVRKYADPLPFDAAEEAHRPERLNSHPDLGLEGGRASPNSAVLLRWTPRLHSR